MASIKEYLRETLNFNNRVQTTAEFLNGSSLQLNELITILEILFDSLRRGSNLINFLRNYSQNFEKEMVRLSEDLVQVEENITSYRNQLITLGDSVKKIQVTTDIIEDTAHSFIKFARTISYLAQNIEVKAYQAKGEGRGLSVIARETYKVASSSQLLFQHFDELLEVIRNNVEPITSEIDEAIKDASVSSNNLIDFLSSLKEVSESIKLLQKFISSTENLSEIISHLEKNINKRLEGIKKQLLVSLNTVDGISIMGSEIHSLSQVLYDIYTIISSRNPDPYLLNQFKFTLEENIRILKKLNIGSQPVLLSTELLDDLNNIINQVERLYELIEGSKVEVENLNSTMDKVSRIKLDINQVFSGIGVIGDKILNFRKILYGQLSIIENLIGICSKVIIKLKTLAIFSKLEKSHSVESQDLIAPIVAEFNQLLDGMNSSFNNFELNVSELKKILLKLDSLYFPKEFVHLTIPDFSRIRIFFDDTIRVFQNCFSGIKDLKELIGKLDQENFLLKQYWSVYEESLRSIINFQPLLQNLLSEKRVVRSLKKNILKINLLNDPVTLKPDLKTDTTSQQVIVNYSTGLFQFGFGTGVIAALCEDYTVSEDGRDYIFHIRENLRYSNGEKLHIEDIKAGIIRALNGPNYNLLEMVAGTKDYLKIKDANLLQVKVIDQHRINVKLEYPYLPFLSSFATNISDPYLDEKLPVGMGPFRLVSWEKGKELTLEANDYYFEGRPSVDILKFIITIDDEMAYELFKNEELSIYQPGQRVLRKIKEEFPELVITTPELSVHFLCFNCQKPPFDNKFVRCAICYGINVEKFVTDLLMGLAIPAKGLFPPSAPAYNRKVSGYRYDPSRSRELLSQAGYPNGLPDTYPLLVSDTQTTLKRAEFIKANLSEIGVRIEIKPLPWHDYLEDYYKGNFSLSLGGWVSDTGDPDNFLYPLFHTNSIGYAGNTFFYSNPDIDKMIENARQIRNVKQRLKYYQEIEEKILDEAPGVFLFHSLKNIAVRKDVRGFKPHPLGIIRAKYVQTYFAKEDKDVLLEGIKPHFATV